MPEENAETYNHDARNVTNQAIINFNNRICCIGAGFVGGPTGAVIAHYNPDIHVSIIDKDTSRIAAWQSSELSIHEPVLWEIITKVRRNNDGNVTTGNLCFTTDVHEAVRGSDIIFICVNTPTKSFGSGAGAAADLSFVESAALLIAEAAESDKIVVQKSTVPVRTAEVVKKILMTNSRSGLEFEVLSNPEFLAEGTAIQDLIHPDRVLIGSMKTPSGDMAARRLTGLYNTWVPQSAIIKTDVWSAELAKLTANALLAQRISSINSLSAICELVGEDVEEIAQIAGLDHRIGSEMLRTSVGFGGSCFQKDILSLCSLADTLHLHKVSAYWRGVLDINDWQKERFTHRLLVRMNNILSMKTIAVWGFAYKKNTGDTRESPAIATVKSLLCEGATIKIYDPQVPGEAIWSELRDARWQEQDLRSRLVICKNATNAAQGAHAIVILTDWDEFSNKTCTLPNSDLARRIDSFRSSPALESGEESVKDRAYKQTSGAASSDGHQDNTSRPMQCLAKPIESRKGIVAQRRQVDWHEVGAVMRRPKYVFDGRNMVDAAKLRDMGLTVEGIGRNGAGGKY